MHTEQLRSLPLPLAHVDKGTLEKGSTSISLEPGMQRVVASKSLQCVTASKSSLCIGLITDGDVTCRGSKPLPHTCRRSSIRHAGMRPNPDPCH
eukprot:1159506-Pelagomonas_calceolata.AAC.5